MELIRKYFPDLGNHQIEKFDALYSIYSNWNKKINVVSRKDIEHLYLRHVLHSLSIALYIIFKPKSRILDLGTGGGFPGIPLALFFPNTDFVLIDGTKKKINVVNAVIKELDINNAIALATRAEDHYEKYDFVVSRAVASLSNLVLWSKKNVLPQSNHTISNGLIALKGGNLENEIQLFKKPSGVEIHPIYELIPELFFNQKYLVYTKIVPPSSI